MTHTAFMNDQHVPSVALDIQFTVHLGWIFILCFSRDPLADVLEAKDHNELVSSQGK